MMCCVMSHHLPKNNVKAQYASFVQIYDNQSGFLYLKVGRDVVEATTKFTGPS